MICDFLRKLFRSKTLHELKTIYEALYSHYDDLHWWPAKTPYEVMVGAVLTQNTSWNNVKKALSTLKGELSPEIIDRMPLETLQERIRSAGFYRQKSMYLKALTNWFLSYDCDISAIMSRPLQALRSELLAVRGIGNETADSILLYAFNQPTFVVDAYTMRLFARYPISAGKNYNEVRKFIMENFPKDILLYNRFHALIVQNAKDSCNKKPLCETCPLKNSCQKIL